MTRPKYKELYEKEKMKTRFTEELLKAIAHVLEDIGLKPTLYTIEDGIVDTINLYIYNPSNNAETKIVINKDRIERYGTYGTNN